MKIKLLGGVFVAAILIAAGIAAVSSAGTEASATSHKQRHSELTERGTSAKQGRSKSKSYIGIAITSAPEDSDASGALIVRVIPGSAADGNLQVNDIITALDGETVDAPREVSRIVRQHAPGEVIVFSIVRDDTSMDISITVGERSASDMERANGKRKGHYRLGLLGRATESLILSDTRYMTDDGVKIVRKAVGTARNIDPAAGTFDLVLRDNSATLSFAVTDETQIAVDSGEGDAGISSLNADTTTMVSEVTHPDGTRHVQLVAQGELSLMMHSLYGGHSFDGHGLDGHRFDKPGLRKHDTDGFSPRRFFFRWFGRHSDEQSDNGRRSSEYD